MGSAQRVPPGWAASWQAPTAAQLLLATRKHTGQVSPAHCPRGAPPGRVLRWPAARTWMARRSGEALLPARTSTPTARLRRTCPLSVSSLVGLTTLQASKSTRSAQAPARTREQAQDGKQGKSQAERRPGLRHPRPASHQQAASAPAVTPADGQHPPVHTPGPAPVIIRAPAWQASDSHELTESCTGSDNVYVSTCSGWEKCGGGRWGWGGNAI